VLSFYYPYPPRPGRASRPGGIKIPVSAHYYWAIWSAACRRHSGALGGESGSQGNGSNEIKLGELHVLKVYYNGTTSWGRNPVALLTPKSQQVQ
jgi:hypothetical protein